MTTDSYKYRLAMLNRSGRRIAVIAGRYESLRTAQTALTVTRARRPRASLIIEVLIDGQWEAYE
jgi:hypothetical protein